MLGVTCCCNTKRFQIFRVLFGRNGAWWSGAELWQPAHIAPDWCVWKCCWAAGRCFPSTRSPHIPPFAWSSASGRDLGEHFVLLTCCLHHMILYKQKEGGLTLDRRRYISSSATRLPRHARIPNPKGTEPNGCCLVLSSAPLSHRWGWKAWGLGKIFSS